jgi:hypothetical protein
VRNKPARRVRLAVLAGTIAVETLRACSGASSMFAMEPPLKS